MLRFIHAADIHLDSPLRGLENYEGAPVEEIRSASRRALENLVRLACEREAAFLLLAGDLFDGQRDDYQSALFLTRQFYRLRDAGVRVFAISGNHDAVSKMTKSLTLPDNVRMLSHKHPETLDLPELHAAIHGQGFAKEAELRNLAAGYPRPLADRFNIGLLHTSLAGREGHAAYAPCSTTELIDKGYDYWALGHVHTREIVAESPWIVFPGNLQGRHVREPGAKGAYVVEVDDRGKATLEFEPLDVLRWFVEPVELSECERETQVLEAVGRALESAVERAEGRLAAVRIELTGACPLHESLAGRSTRWVQEIRARAAGVSADRLWIEKVKFNTRSPRSAENRLDPDGPLAALRELLVELRSDEGALRELAGAFADLRAKLPAEAAEATDGSGDDSTLPNDAAGLRRLLDEVEPLLATRLLHPEESV